MACAESDVENLALAQYPAYHEVSDNVTGGTGQPKMLRSFCLEPRKLTSAATEQLRRLQPLYHKLYDGIARDVEWVSATVGGATHKCAWLEHELAIAHA